MQKLKKRIAGALICALVLGATTFASVAANGNSLKVTTVSDVWEMGTLYEFVVKFNNEIASEATEDLAVEQSDLITGNVIDHVFINGKSVRTINAIGVDEKGNELSSVPISVRFSKPRDYKGYCLELYMETRLAKEYNLRMDGTDTITFKKGLTFPEGGSLGEDVTYVYDTVQKVWEKQMDTEVECGETKLTVVEFAANTDGSVNPAVIMLKFDKPVSYQMRPYISSGDNYWTSLKEAGIVDYTEAEKEDFRNLGIRDSILDNIIIDGLSIREMLATEKEASHYNEETGKEEVVPAELMQQISITSNYEGSNYQGGKYLGLYFNALSSMIPDVEKEHTLTIAPGFVTPLLTETTESQTFVWIPEYRCWMPEKEAADFR